MGPLGKDSVQAGTFKGFLDVSLRTSGAQLGWLDIVDQMFVQLRMGLWGFTMFWGGHILVENIFVFVSRLLLAADL